MGNSAYRLPPPPSGTLCQGTFVVARLVGVGLLTSVQVGYHEFWSDGMLEEGGQNLGPAPYDLLLAALATCTVMTLRLHARHRGWSLHRIGVHLTHVALSAAEALRQPVAERIEVQLELSGELDLEQRRQLRVVAAACPVARVLGPGILIETILL